MAGLGGWWRNEKDEYPNKAGPSPTVRDLTEPGWRERENARDAAFAAAIPSMDCGGSHRRIGQCHLNHSKKIDCPNMQEREGDMSMTHEHYDCRVCGAHIAFDYEEMK